MCTKLHFYFCIPYHVLTTKYLVSTRHHTVDPLSLVHPPLCSFPSDNHYFVLCIYMFVWFGSVRSFILCLFFYIAHMSEILQHLFFCLTYFT